MDNGALEDRSGSRRQLCPLRDLIVPADLDPVTTLEVGVDERSPDLEPFAA